MTQEQRRRIAPQADVDSAPAAPPVTPFDERPSLVRILAGAQVQEMALVGQTVGEARGLAETVFAVDPGAQAFVDGRRVRDDHVLERGQELEFVKRTGEKGAQEQPEEPAYDPDDEEDIARMLAQLRAPELPLRPARQREPGVSRAEQRRALMERLAELERSSRPRKVARVPRRVPGLTLEVVGEEVVWRRGDRTMGRASVADLVASAAAGGTDRERWLVHPRGVRLMAERDGGDVVGVVIEMEPGPRKVSWILDGSEAPCGPGARYTTRRLSFPWVVLLVVFAGGELTDVQQVFYRTQPIGSPEDPLYYTNLLNCMPSTHGLEAKLCLRKMRGRLADLTWEERVKQVTAHFWEASFNRSADVEERKSYYWTGRSIDTRLSTVAAWERATEELSYFALDVPWRLASFSVGETLERMLDEVAPRPELDRVEGLVTAIQRRQEEA